MDDGEFLEWRGAMLWTVSPERTRCVGQIERCVSSRRWVVIVKGMRVQECDSEHDAKDELENYA